MDEMETLSKLVELSVDCLMTTNLRLMALQSILEARGTVTREAIAAKMEAMDDEATLEIEYGPQYEEFRRVKRIVRARLKKLEEERGAGKEE